MAKKRRMNHTGFAVMSATTGLLKSIAYVLLIVGIALALSAMAITVVNDVFALVKQENIVTLKFDYEVTGQEMAEMLEENGVIQYAPVFRVFTVLKDVQSFKAGEYELNSTMDYGQIIDTLRGKKVRNIVRVTIPEGYTMKQIAELMEQNKVCLASEFIETANTYPFSHKVLQDVPMTENRLEGYLFPDPYEFYEDENTVSVVNKMLNNFEKRYTKAMRNLTEKNGKTIAEIVVLASLIEREAMWESERTMISGVIYNRLNAPDRFPMLQIDATLLYVTGHKESLTAEDLLIDSPYNTYMYEGLPPTAICNPGLNALLAAISPEQNEYYYYVLMVDEYCAYAKTEEEYLALLEKDRIDRENAAQGGDIIPEDELTEGLPSEDLPPNGDDNEEA